MGIPTSYASADADARRTVRVLRIETRDGRQYGTRGSRNAKFPNKRTTNFK